MLRVMLEISLTSVELEVELEQLSAQKVENVSPSLTSSRGGVFFAGVPVSVEKGFLKQSRASCSENYLIPIDL